MKKPKAPSFSIKTQEELIERLQITAWDYIIFGDGSGSTWKRPCGWAAVLIERRTHRRRVWHGTVNKGTVNFAEIMAYAAPFNWLSAQELDRRAKNFTPRILQVHVVTDSQYCRDGGKKKFGRSGKNASLFSMYDVLARQGIVVTWHWLPRESTHLNCYCDELSRLARLRQQDYNLLQDVSGAKGGLSVYSCTPVSAVEQEPGE